MELESFKTETAAVVCNQKDSAAKSCLARKCQKSARPVGKLSGERRPSRLPTCALTVGSYTDSV